VAHNVEDIDNWNKLITLDPSEDVRQECVKVTLRLTEAAPTDDEDDETQ
jgi:hypothetical protein